MQKVIPNRCQGKTKAGQPCKAAPTAGGLCFFHANPNKASELGRIGGAKKKRNGSENGITFGDVNDALAVREMVSRLITEVSTGNLHPRIASGLVPLLNLQLRAIETADLDVRLTKLEKAQDDL
jgi:hypothetical protein